MNIYSIRSAYSTKSELSNENKSVIAKAKALETDIKVLGKDKWLSFQSSKPVNCGCMLHVLYMCYVRLCVSENMYEKTARFVS